MNLHELEPLQWSYCRPYIGPVNEEHSTVMPSGLTEQRLCPTSSRSLSASAGYFVVLSSSHATSVSIG
ncbi:hypothetical protein VTH06DRAFT_6759 [Thermothelomyces fergusii]